MPVTPDIKRFVRRVRLAPKALAQAPVGTINRHIVQPGLEQAREVNAKIHEQFINSIDRVSGLKAGNSAFWRRRKSPNWSSVDLRLRRLSKLDANAVSDFVRTAYENSRKPDVLVNLSRSALTREHMRRLLEAETLDENSVIYERVRTSGWTCAGFVAAASLLLDEKASAEFAKKVMGIAPSFSSKFMQFIDCLGTVPTADFGPDVRGRLQSSGFCKPKERRLILTPAVENASLLALLAQGARSTTVFAYNDLYGKADFSDHMVHAGKTLIQAEHPRSRISRFSADYHRVHEETRREAERLVAALADEFEGHFEATDMPGAALALADNLFFPALQFNAVQLLLDSDEFDHIVISLGMFDDKTAHRNEAFCRFLAGIDGLMDDPRVEIVASAVPSDALEEYEASIAPLYAPQSPVARRQRHQASLAPALRSFQTQSERVVQDFDPWTNNGKPRVMFAMAQVAAYNRSSAAFCNALATFSNLHVAFMGGNLLSFSEDTDNALQPHMVTPVPQRPHGNFELMRAWIVNFLRYQRDQIQPSYLGHVIESRIEQVAEGGVLSHMAHAHLCDRWFAWLKAQDALPQVVVLSPFRSSRVSTLTAIARRYNVPTIAVEPHGLNADYCRYCKVTADYYGVITSYFAQAAVDGFGMSLDRSPIIGSPRLNAPKDYDISAATQAARERFRKDASLELSSDQTVLTYFSQPSDWGQISEVWKIVLESTEDLDCLVILKTHPEETASRVDAYMAIADQMQARDRIRWSDIDAVTAIEASDLVLSGYSATVLEAALYRRPVFCVTNGDVDYPLNQHDVIGAPFLRSAKTLRAEIKSFMQDPSPYRAVANTFLEREPQLVEGFAERLESLIQDIVSKPADAALRPQEDLPKSFFLDGPHTVYQV